MRNRSRPLVLATAGLFDAFRSGSEERLAAVFSGVVLVARNGKPLLHRAWGLASREHGVANRPDTKFNLGSINELFTKIAVA